MNETKCSRLGQASWQQNSGTYEKTKGGGKEKEVRKTDIAYQQGAPSWNATNSARKESMMLGQKKMEQGGFSKHPYLTDKLQHTK